MAKKLIPKKGTIVNGKKVTEKQRKFFTDMCSMEDGGQITSAWLNKYPIAQNGISLIGNPRDLVNKPTGESTKLPKRNVELEQKVAVNPLIKNQGSLKEISKKEFDKTASASDVLLNPLTALKYKVKGQPIPSNFTKGERNPLDYATDIVNPSTYIKAAYNTVGNVMHPINTVKTLAKASTNLATNLVDGRNAYNDGSNEKALGIIGDAALTLGIKSGIKNTLNIADKQFSKVGQQLEKIRMEGEAAGLDAHTIAKNQMEQVGITSNQRQGYNPIISNLAEKYVTPYGYEGFGNQSKLQQTWDNIKKGGVDFGKNDKGAFSRQHVTNERGDAWKLYLGKPQTKGTFKLADTAPVNHPSYTGDQLKGMDIYNLDAEGATVGIEPGYMSKSLLNPHTIEENMDLLRNKINIDKGNEVMGGYNKSLTKEGLQYNDIWDLNPQITPSRYIPKRFQNALDENPLLYKKTNSYGYLPRSFKIPVDKIMGKPFMSHGNLPTTSTDLVNKMNNVISSGLEDAAKSSVDMTPRITKYQQYLDELKNYPKYQNGGKLSNDWLKNY